MKFTWYLTLKPLHPWNAAPGKDDRINESIAENFSIANHHSENIGKGIPPTETQKQIIILRIGEKNGYYKYEAPSH
jgi:hypothetical protein